LRRNTDPTLQAQPILSAAATRWND
jgi:hypothetical protein